LRRSHPFQEEIMHMTKGWSGLRTAVIALSLFAWTTTGVKAAALLDYSTSLASIGPAGINGAPVVNFVGLQDATVDPTSSNFALGNLQVAKLPDGASTTYTNTPIEISVLPNAFGGSSLTGAGQITINGLLNGTISNNLSSVNLTFNSVSNGTFDLGGSATSTVNVLQKTPTLVVPYSDTGVTSLEGTIMTNGSPNPYVPAPEPSTIALFLSTIGGLGLRRYVLSRRRENRA